MLVMIGSPVSAVTVSGLYSVEVPVAGSSESELKDGYADGLARVFVRVSGSRSVLEREGVPALLENAESLLLSYQFLRDEEGGNRLRMGFGAVGVNRALASVDAPVWGANRPLTLAWVAVEDRGARTLVTAADDNASEPFDSWQAAFSAAARNRGLPISLPPSQLSGNRELLSDIWGQFIGRIQDRSDDLDHDVLAVMRVSRSGGQWRAGWVFDGMGMDVGEEAVTAASPGALAEAVINRWADLYAERYAVAAGDIAESPQVDIVVRGVSSLADYGDVNNVLGGLTPVVSVGAARVKGDQLTLRVAFSGELDQLREYIALDPRFVPLEGDSPAPETNSQAMAEPPAQGDLPAAGDERATEADDGQGRMEPGEASLFTYQPVEVDEQEAEEAFESLYQVLYYRWQPASVIGSGQ
ncbi:hypothetical protein D777_01388 [Marinobacter nitratireducens]|uniref:DUF2066 domain-containing protein n=2 Tax=Marinobacter nitratireducens TaxID=1137280 RepID=A0A072N4W6_9GAMM|nr:hypothetical protein D777_01388 [Marinobacter nitratireducens]